MTANDKITIYTTAPVNMDMTGTESVDVPGIRDAKGRRVRRVRIGRKMARSQKALYRHGGYMAARGDEWATIKATLKAARARRAVRV